ncbi:glycoside hydrolase family 3 protein [Biscogniauxia marginata]|nr:glycoside hydrolase family 3 protein [Biscogniauxia marginata]
MEARQFFSFAALLVTSAVAREFPNCESGPLVAALSHNEKISNSWDNSPGSSSIGLPSYEWWNEALHGVARSRGVQFANSGNFSYATSFPQPITMGAAFDMPLIRSVAETTSTEARAFSNDGRCGLNFWTPNINPFRDPRWGRGQEVPSEDPYHMSQYVMQLIPGLQGGLGVDEDNPYYKLAATCKHYAGYDMENWKGNRRYAFDAKITSQDLQDYYLQPFRACVRDANAQSVMCSYNAVNGVPTCADPWLLQNVLRELYGFASEDRYVTADCDALGNVWTDHHYGSSAAGAAAASLNAGTDLDCGQFWPQNLPSAYNSRLFNDTVLDRSLIRRYASMVRLGWFDPPANQPYRQLGWDAVAKPEAKALALRAAQEGLVLLKNNGTGALPLAASVKRVAVIGPLSTATTQMQGNYYGTAQSISTVVSAFTAAGYQVSNTQGCAITGSSTSGFAAALSAAQAADAIVFVGGMDTSIEAEDRDREQITWPGAQVALVKQLAAAKGDKPFAVVQMGTMVDSSELVAEAGVDALLWAGYPGQDGGAAIVSMLTGQVAPAGRLPVTQYPASYVDQVPMTNMNLQSGAGNPGRTYKWYTETPVFPFGHGLHYTSFNVSLPAADLPTTFSTDSLTSDVSFTDPGPVASGNYPDLAPFTSLPVSVTNTGNATSDYVVLAFLKGEYGPAPYPNKSLVAFTRLHDIEPGSTATETLDIKLGSVARSDEDGRLTLWPGRYTLVLDIDDRAAWDFEITGEAVVLETLPPKT